MASIVTFQCSLCKQAKQREDFYWRSSGDRVSRCKECLRDNPGRRDLATRRMSNANAVAQWRKKHRERYLVQRKVQYAIDSGLITRPFLCSRCISTSDIQAHHKDYTKPFEIEWLCRQCHNIADTERRNAI